MSRLDQEEEQTGSCIDEPSLDKSQWGVEGVKALITSNDLSAAESQPHEKAGARLEKDTLDWVPKELWNDTMPRIRPIPKWGPLGRTSLQLHGKAGKTARNDLHWRV